MSQHEASEWGISNWGRWGNTDEQGTWNLLTPERIQQAATLVRRGQTYSLAMPLAADGPQWPQRHPTWRVTTYHNDPRARGGADDVVTMHSHSGTHMDALCHVWYHDQLYNGFPASQHVGSQGATRNAIDRLPFLVGRGVLLDIAGWKEVDHLALGEPISASDLAACAAAQQVEVRTGDILLVRTGWLRVFANDPATFNQGEPGLDTSTLDWLHERDVVAIGADNHGIEVMQQIPPDDIPFHRCAIRDLGMYLLENLHLEQLAADRTYEFLFITTPLPLSGGVGSPISPLAIA